MKEIILLFVFIVFGLSLKASEQKENVNVRYKESSRIDFESLLVEGEKRKAELSIVTGEQGEKDNGLMIMRENFVDHMSSDFSEELK